MAPPSRSNPPDSPKPPVDQDFDPVPLVPVVEETGRPSLRLFEAALRQDAFQRRYGLSGGKRYRGAHPHFTSAEHALIKACAEYSGEDPSAMMRRFVIAKLREEFA